MNISIITCIIPHCGNTSVNSPNKRFLFVPNLPKTRANWGQTLGIPKLPFHSFCCEDHLDLENDTQNRMGHMGAKLQLRGDVLPLTSENKSGNIKGNVLSDDLKEKKAENLRNFAEKEEIKVEEIKEEETVETLHIQQVIAPKSTQEPANSTVTRILLLPSTQVSTSPAFSGVSLPLPPLIPISSKPIESSPINQQPATSFIAMPANITNHKKTKPQSTKKPKLDPPEITNEEKSETSHQILDDFMTGTKRRQGTIQLSWCYPHIYLGIPKRLLKIVNLISQYLHLPVTDIFLTFTKIKHNNIQRTGIDYSYCLEETQQIFEKSVRKIARQMQNFIYLPHETPVNFKKPRIIRKKKKPSNNHTLIDCFKVDIERPTQFETDADTWTEIGHRSCLKFFVSCTPSGHINFVSRAYAGRITDTEILKQCDYLKRASRVTSIFGGIKFKHARDFLEKKKCTLITPRSGRAEMNCSESEIEEGKSAETSIVRLGKLFDSIRQFSSMRSCINHDMLEFVDEVAIIVCALINLEVLVGS